MLQHWGSSFTVIRMILVKDLHSSTVLKQVSFILLGHTHGIFIFHSNGRQWGMAQDLKSLIWKKKHESYCPSKGRNSLIVLYNKILYLDIIWGLRDLISGHAWDSTLLIYIHDTELSDVLCVEISLFETLKLLNTY